MALLCYGALAGGFLTDRWLHAEEPAGLTLNRSLVKYGLVIDELGGWASHQRILSTLRELADEHGVDVAAVAVRFVLDQPGVAAVITGASRARQVASTMRAFEVELGDLDHRRIRSAAGGGYGPPGDVYELETDRSGPHGRIMKYGLQDGSRSDLTQEPPA
jgi:aryl-alcohol dehydrogenase-like predicted oxidoreductase